MEIYGRIGEIFNDIRNTIKTIKSPERVYKLKSGIHALSSELEVLGKENHELYGRSIAMSAYLSLIAVKTTPLSLHEKRKTLETAFEKLRPFACRLDCLFIFLRVQNLLCFYHIQMDQLTTAQRLLEETEKMYEEINKRKSKYYDTEDLFTTPNISEIAAVNPDKIDRIITNNIQMQAFIYNKLSLPDKYCLYSHTALRRQLELKDGTPQEWALKVARLGKVFICLNQMDNAKHHLCAAYHILQSCHEGCKLMPNEFIQQKANFEMYFLEISLYWVKYGLTLFKLSKKEILNKYFTKDSDTVDLWKSLDVADSEIKLNYDVPNSETEKNGEGDCHKNVMFVFPTLNLKDAESRIPSTLVKHAVDGRKLFLFTYKWLMRARNYYDINQHAAHYISCSLHLAELYEHLAFFERNVDNQYKLQKRRAEVLESLNTLLKTCNSAASVQIDVIRELSQVQLELMALNLQKLWCEESQTDISGIDGETESVLNSLATASEKTLNTSCKNLFLRKMEAATAISGKLHRLSDQLSVNPVSEVSFTSTDFLN